MTLSKSQYVKGRKCVKRLWLFRHQRGLAGPPSLFHEGILEQGREVGELGRTLYPGGELIGEDYTQPDEALAHTARAMAAGKTALFEAAYVFDGVLIRADIMRKNADGSWDLLEIKSGTTRARPKKEYLFDLAIQKHVLLGAGVKLKRVLLVRLERSYRRQGALQIDQLFKAEEVDSWILPELEKVPVYLDTLRKTIDSEESPSIEIGSFCKYPYPCEFKQHCWGSLATNSFHYLCFMRAEQRAALGAKGITTLLDIQDEWLEDPRQKKHVEAEKNGVAVPDLVSLNQHLDLLRYPRYFLDFETYGYAIPQYEMTRPYQRLVFQFSLHVQRSEGAPFEHYEHLCTEAVDPRRGVAEALVKFIGPEGSIIVYHADFEGGVLEELAHEFPDLAEKLRNFATRLWDLEIPFAERWVCQANFKGRSSIKNILPAVVPGFGYGDLEIQDGEQAMRGYFDLIDPKASSQVKEKTKKALLDYCGRDTWAMVEILNWLTKSKMSK